MTERWMQEAAYEIFDAEHQESGSALLSSDIAEIIAKHAPVASSPAQAPDSRERVFEYAKKHGIATPANEFIDVTLMRECDRLRAQNTELQTRLTIAVENETQAAQAPADTPTRDTVRILHDVREDCWRVLLHDWRLEGKFTKSAAEAMVNCVNASLKYMAEAPAPAPQTPAKKNPFPPACEHGVALTVHCDACSGFPVPGAASPGKER